MSASISPYNSVPFNYALDTTIERIFEQLLCDDVHAGMEELFTFLWLTREKSTDQEWQHFTSEYLLNHPIKDILLEEPLTRHAFTRPRGYPGDADLIDYIYQHRSLNLEHLPPRVREIHNYLVNVRASKAVRYRRDFMAKLIDKVAEEHANCRMMSLACGHLREAELSSALRSRCINEFIAIDQDTESLAVVKDQYGDLGIKTISASAYMLVAGILKVGSVHLAYASGLYDYLAQPFARRLTLALFNSLSPGGRLVIVNFRPGIKDIGYMESFLNWSLIYRSDSEALDLFSLIPTENIKRIVVSYDPYGNLVFLEAVRHL